MSLKSSLIILMFLIAGFSRGAEPQKVNSEEILQDQVWKDVYNQIEFDRQKLQMLSALIRSDLKIEVYFAFWCSDSRNNLPVFKKLIDNLEVCFNSAIDYFLVERKASKDVEFYYQPRQVRRIPTFIVFCGGLEIGRIVENPEVSILDDLIKVLSTTKEEVK